MNSVYILVRYDDDGETIEEIISAHPTRQTAMDAERFYRAYEGNKFEALMTNVLEVDFET